VSRHQCRGRWCHSPTRCAEALTPSTAETGKSVLLASTTAARSLQQAGTKPRGTTWGVGHGSRGGPRRRGRSEARISKPDHEPSNYGSFGQQARSVPAGIIAPATPSLASRPVGRGASPVSGGGRAAAAGSSRFPGGQICRQGLVSAQDGRLRPSMHGGLVRRESGRTTTVLSVDCLNRGLKNGLRVPA
jgi:hypothetical protein